MRPHRQNTKSPLQIKFQLPQPITELVWLLDADKCARFAIDLTRSRKNGIHVRNYSSIGPPAGPTPSRAVLLLLIDGHFLAATAEKKTIRKFLCYSNMSTHACSVYLSRSAQNALCGDSMKPFPRSCHSRNSISVECVHRREIVHIARARSLDTLPGLSCWKNGRKTLGTCGRSTSIAAHALRRVVTGPRQGMHTRPYG